MSFKGMTYISISRQKHTFQNEIKPENFIPQSFFREYINSHKTIFLWKEETELGKSTALRIETYDKKDRVILLKTLKQYQAFAFYKKIKGYYELDVCWNEQFGHIMVNFNNSRVTIQALEILLEMATYCDAMLLVNGKKEITKEFIEKEKLDTENKKAIRK